MPNPRLHGAFRKILVVILCGCLTLQSGCVPVSVPRTQASNQPAQNSGEHLPQAESQTPDLKFQIPYFTPAAPAPSASSVNASTTAEKDRSSFAIVVSVWDAVARSGNNVAYRVVNFAQVRLTDYHLSSENRISARFLGYATCAGATPIPRPASFTVVTAWLSRSLAPILTLMQTAMVSSR